MINSTANTVTPGFFKYRLGTLDMILITDGAVPYDTRCFAPGIPANTLAQLREKSTPFLLPHNILVLLFDERIVMIDAGNGSKAGPHAGQLPANLRAAGIAPEDVTDIVLSHAHPDHINGLTEDNQQLVFPNAKIHLSEKEFEYWQNEADFSKSKHPAAELAILQKEIQFFFASVAAKLQLFDETAPLFDCLQPIAAPGHTPGHCLFSIHSGNEKLVHLADIFHDEIVLFARPEWGTVFDIDFELAACTRRKILEDYAASGQRVLGYHLPLPGLGYIVKEHDLFRWVPGH
ncbi:MBL fold metallo-hydrolase [Chitinophaga arvensicola]|uniref:Glyoxylase, beta-lactamase superfamily II n=1 Tax=Chitinophaga arvensicola TaxID=29529 RepID=A0A1I0S8L0_9BACT|nr:MBL fold metallo-hydrolase [Chitinophaga arvensicola]SEW52188.1 Glyoxylase, beta-lactamase superfamily II [Chitinophaga arvensicola]